MPLEYDPFHPHNDAQVGVNDILAFRLALRKMSGEKIATDTPEANFTAAEIQMAHQIVADTNEVDNKLGIRVVADNDAPTPLIPRSYHLLYKSLMHTYLSEGDKVSRTLVWYKIAFWALLILQVIDLVLAFAKR